MRFIRVLSLHLITLIIGCTSTSPRYTNADYVAANKYCFGQAEEDKRALKRQWFTQWLTCTQERVMPIEISVYPSKEDEIKKMYEKLFIRAKDVDSGQVRVETVYAEWDQMQKDIRMAPCILRIKGRDGSERCISRGSTN